MINGLSFQKWLRIFKNFAADQHNDAKWSNSSNNTKGQDLRSMFILCKWQMVVSVYANTYGLPIPQKKKNELQRQTCFSLQKKKLIAIFEK